MSKASIPMSDLRDQTIENDLQSAIDTGHNVWVIGDVHGFNETLRYALEQLELTPEDRVVLLGDLIDRGPDSFDVVRMAREDSRIQCVKGNHEHMMVQNFSVDSMEHPTEEMRVWFHCGGRETVSSYLRAFPEDAAGAMKWMLEEDKTWMESLPSHIVLDRWRLVHAGYNPNTAVEDQVEADLLWIRKPFHSAHSPIDPQRTVVFGHTPTMNLYPKSDDRLGEVWSSDVHLDDGRPASIGIDTCVFHKIGRRAVLSAFNLQTQEVRSFDRREAWREDDWIRARFVA